MASSSAPESLYARFARIGFILLVFTDLYLYNSHRFTQQQFNITLVLLVVLNFLITLLIRMNVDKSIPFDQHLREHTVKALPMLFILAIIYFLLLNQS
jgi:hypothetical protein